MDTENTEEDMENMDCEQIKPVEEISPAPSYLPQNDQSIHQPKQQLRDRTPRKRRNKRLRPDETTSPAPSCTSLQSDQSIDRPIQFQKSAQNRVLRPDETTSRALSCTSLQSDQSIDRPIQFQKSAQNRVVRPDEATSPAPSCTSLQSDQSIDRPIQFQKCTQNRVLRPDEATSPAPSCTSLQSDQSIDRPIQFQKCTQNRVLRPDETTSPAPSCTSLQSDQSIDRPIQFQKSAQNRVLRPDEATSPAPSCTSLQSDQSIDRPIQFQKSAQNRVLRPDETTSPAPSCTSLQSDQSIDRPIQFQKCTQNRVLRPDETTSPALSCTSLQSDQSIDRPIQFQKSAQNRVVRPDEATSPAPSCTSLQSDQSIDRPIQFQKCTQNRVLRPDETTSPAPSCTSLQSDQSIDRHIQFQKSAQNRVLRPDEATSPAPSCTSLQSDQSIDRPIQFQKSAQNRVIGKNVKEPFRRHDSSLRTEVMSPDISTFSATLLTEDHYRCSVCTEIFKNPVSIPCGHSYCKHCIEIYWNKPTQAECYACPQCRKRFRDRPVLNVNVALSKLIEELKRAGFSPALPSHCYAGPEDVSCDICSDMKLKAVKSCLTCDVSYCDTHIRQHYTVPALQRHNLIKPYNISSDSKIPTTSSAVTGFQETIKLLTTELIKVKSTLREKDSQAKRLCQGFEIHCNVFPSDIIEVAALGRPLCIGMLYDTESDSYSQTSFLWKDGIIASMRVSLPRPQTDVKVLDGDSLQDRFKALEMSSVLRSRALHGQVEMNGAAAFLNHPVQSEHQDRVTLHYKTTTRLDMISQTLLQEGVSPSLLNITTATHVIIAVSYGAQAFFVFDSKRISAETNTEIKNVIMKMMTTFSEQEILSCLTNTERDDSNLYTCNVYIDVGDWKSPVSFDKAVEIYSSLPELLGSKGERAVPLKVWLYPLKKLDKTSVCAALNGVSKGLMYRAENVLQHLNKQIRTCQDLMTSPDNLCVIIWFPALKDIFVKFSELLQKYQADFQEEITEIAEDIQVKEEEEERRIQHLLERHERSPFNAENISQWLENKDTELKILNDCKAADITVVKTQTEFQQIINHPQITRVMCFTLTSPDVEDSFLTALKQHIESDHITQTDSLQFKPVNISQKVLVDIQVYIASKETNENAEQTRFIAASLPDEGFPECSVRFYYEGRIVSRNIEFGVKPDLAQIDQIKHNSVSMKCDHLDKKDIERYVVEYQVVVDDEINTWKQTTVYADTFKGKCVLSGLEQDTEYQLRYAVCYNQRMSNFSWIVSLKTSSVARPGQPSVTKLSRDTLRVEWLKAEADEDCPVLHYMVEYKEAGLEGWSSVQTQASQCEYTLTTPHSTCYRVRVSAVYEHITSKPSEETSVPVDVWRINLSERKSSILLEVLKLQTEKKPVELIDWTHEESEVRGFLQCLPYISLLGFIEAPNESSELWKESKIFIKNLFLQAALCQKEIIETTVKMLLSSVDYGKCDFLLDLCSHVKNYERETGKSVLPALQSIYHQSSPEVWRINLSKRKSSILLEVLKLHTEKKPVELIDWTHEESEVRGFLQCLPYISQLRFIKPSNESSELWEKRKRLFVLDLCLQAALCQKEIKETTVKMLLSSVNYEKCDFLLDLYSHVKNYESETGKSVLPALQSIYHQSSPEVWRINLSERKSSILLEVLKLQTEKKPVELIDWTHEESEVRGFLQSLPYISQLRFIEPSNQSSELWKKSKILFIKNLILQAALCQKEIKETTVNMLLSSMNYEKCDFLLDLCSHVKNYESETGRSVLPALQSIYHQSSPEVWRINLSERKSSILLEVLKLQTEKKPVELIDWTHEESEVRGFLQCLPYISQLRFTDDLCQKRESGVQFLGNLFTAASEFDTNTEEKYTELLTSVCSYTTFPFYEEYYNEDDEYQVEQTDFLLDLCSHVKNYESETGRSVLPALQSIYHQSSPAMWTINLSERKSSILLEVLKLQTEKKPVELIDWTHEESEVRGFLQCLPYISQLRFKDLWCQKRESAAQFLGNLFTAASEFDTNTEEKYTELLTSVCSYTTFPFYEEYYNEDDEYQVEQTDFLLDLCSHVKNYESETGRSVLPALQSIYHQSSPEVWRINLSERKSSILLEVLKLQTEKKPVELIDWTHEESEVRGFLQCLPYISQLRFEQGVGQYKSEKCFQFLVNLSVAASEFDTNTEEKYTELLTSVCSYTTFPFDEENYNEDDEYQIYQCDFLLDLCSHVKNYESETGRSVLPALQSIYHQSSPEVWRINLSERKSSILLEVLKLQTEKKPVELIDWTHEESEVRGFLQCLPYISQLRFERRVGQYKSEKCFQFLVNLSVAASECETDTGEKYTKLFTSVCNYTSFPFEERNFHGFQFNIVQSDFLLDLYSHVKNYESETDRSVLPALQSIYHQSSPAMWTIKLSERKSSILLEVLKLQTEKKPVELIDWTHEESEVRGFLQCLPYISLLRNSEKCFPSVCKEFGLKVKRDQVTPLLQTVMFTVTLSGKLPSSTCRCVGRVLSLSPSTLNLTLKPQAISLRGVRSLFRHITHLQRLSLEDRMVMMMVRALRSFNGHSLLNTDELSVVTKDSKLTHSRIVSSLTSLLRRLSVRCLDLTECKLEAVSVTALLCLQGLQTIRLSEETSKKLVSVVCEAQDDELTRCFLEKVSKGLTSCSLTWKQIQYLLQHQTLDFDFRKSKISTENIRELLPCLGRVHLKRLTPSFVLSIIMEIYESRSPQYVSGLLSSAENLINLRNKVLNSVQCAALRFTLQHCNTVKLNLFWTSIPDEELKSFLPLLNRLTQLSVDRQLLLKLLHCCSSSDDQQEAADLLLSALHNRLDFSCCSIQDLTVTEENQNYLNLTNEDCKMISSVLQKNKSVVKLVLEDCKVSDTALKQLLPILSQVQLSCSKDLLLQFMTCISEDTEKGSVRWTRALSQALGEELDLSHTQMDQRACKQLAVFLEYSDGLTELDLSHCKLTDQYMETLLPHLHKTQTLDLSYNSITDELTNRIHSVVSTHNNIQTVRLFGNRIKDRKLFFRDKRFEIW
ncbi:uncharacterized protein si:ch211-281l24.3 isoform X7 [Triplophysa dalaica]|uniref:uncharacterized protein si:ch211-281l24.3 isoform X7 n=1 Tax=Triplophysa dalaica TaxID=1582913 RepID=UPI0024DF864F|nr:uncharacterized protein si:ch211-281l24.3 isoform X7 [Triplophysa dalaica]